MLIFKNLFASGVIKDVDNRLLLLVNNLGEVILVISFIISAIKSTILSKNDFIDNMNIIITIVVSAVLIGLFFIIKFCDDIPITIAGAIFFDFLSKGLFFYCFMAILLENRFVKNIKDNDLIFYDVIFAVISVVALIVFVVAKLPMLTTVISYILLYCLLGYVLSYTRRYLNKKSKNKTETKILIIRKNLKLKLPIKTKFKKMKI